MENIINRNLMEKTLHSRFLNSQDQLIISLNEQIEAMNPLRESYSSLQRYHLKLLHDFQTLASEHDVMVSTFSSKILELNTANDELEARKNSYVDGLRTLENEKAKLTLERKNLMSCCETLSNKFNLENQQSVLLQERNRDLSETIKRTEQNISITKKIISEIEAEIRLKTSESTETENQISRRIDFNRKTAQKIEATEAQIKASGLRKEKTLSDMRDLDKKQDDLEYKIRDELRTLKELNEKILTKKDQLAQLSHQKEYYNRLIESEQVIKEDLEISEHKLNALLERRIKECERVEKENLDLCDRIKEQQQNHDKSSKYKESLLLHISELVRANAVLLETMKRSCKQDEKAHLILNKKLDNLDSAIIRSSQPESLQIYRKTVLRQRTNEFSQISQTKKAEKTGTTWIKQLDMQAI